MICCHYVEGLFGAVWGHWVWYMYCSNIENIAYNMHIPLKNENKTKTADFFFIFIGIHNTNVYECLYFTVIYRRNIQAKK